MVTCALHALPRASGPKDWISVAWRPPKIDAAFPMIIPQRMTPCPPNPAMRISVLVAMVRSVGRVLLAEMLRVMRVHRVEPRWPFAVDEGAHDDAALEREVPLLRVGPVLDDALFLVVFDLVDPVAKLVAARVERGAGRENFDEGETLL